MDDLIFGASDFGALDLIRKFNEEHWKGSETDLGWRYDLENDDPKVVEIRESLQKIQDKLESLRAYFAGKNEYTGLVSAVQKKTNGRTNRYLSHLWLYFVKGLENKPPNEPQLQITIKSQGISTSLWFENKKANEEYLRDFIDNYSEHLKSMDKIAFEVYAPQLGGKLTNSYSKIEWNEFVKEISSLNYDCKVSLNTGIDKDEVLSSGKGIVSLIDKHLSIIKPLFDHATNPGKRFILANIEWNDYGWTKPQIPSNPSFGYAIDGNMPHDTLNFKFDKPADTGDNVYGYFQTGIGGPKEFLKCKDQDKIIFFYSRRKIVGAFGAAEYLSKTIEYDHNAFENGKHFLNIVGRRDLSLGFLKEAQLDSRPEYMNDKVMGRSNFIYISCTNAKRILEDVISKYQKIIAENPQDNDAKEQKRKLNNLIETLGPLPQLQDKNGEDVFDLLSEKKQIILYGPPGTGKTYKAHRVAIQFLRGDQSEHY
ncbi:MAG: hypothetical protein ABSG57_01515 [Candidatus Bathyarchaeia archaeon]